MAETTKLSIGNRVYREDFFLTDKELQITEFQYSTVKSERIFKLDEISLRKEIIHNDKNRFGCFIPIVIFLLLIAYLTTDMLFFGWVSYLIVFVVLGIILMKIINTNLNFIIFETKRGKRIELPFYKNNKVEVILGYID